MPKIVFTKDNLPKVLSILDKWRGKLTMDLFCEEVAKELGVESIDRGTMYAQGEIKAAFQIKKEKLRLISDATPDKESTIEMLLKEKAADQSKIDRLEDMLIKFKEQFVRWQKNLYMMSGVDLDRLNKELEAPLPSIKRK
jgi:N-acyl-D-aspartate/D-glutamate deacylase